MFANAIFPSIFLCTLIVSGCSSPLYPSIDPIESISHKGFCTDEFGQELQPDACSKKAVSEVKEEQTDDSKQFSEALQKALDKQNVQKTE